MLKVINETELSQEVKVSLSINDIETSITCKNNEVIPLLNWFDTIVSELTEHNNEKVQQFAMWINDKNLNAEDLRIDDYYLEAKAIVVDTYN